MKESETPPSVKTAPTQPTVPKFSYIGPDYTNGIMRGGVLFQPKLMTEAQIESLLATQEWAKDWFQKA